MLPAFNSASLRSRLGCLSCEQQLTFGALCCERLIPNYLAFQNDTNWGDVTALRNSLDLVWKALGDHVIADGELSKAISSCEAVVPYSENFSSPFVTAAQDACFSICSLLDYLLKPDVDKIVQVATYSTDSVDLYIQELVHLSPTDPFLEERILSHQLMQRELARQDTDLHTIESSPSLPHMLLKMRRGLSTTEKGNLDFR